jgi:hypothetical protein
VFSCLFLTFFPILINLSLTSLVLLLLLHYLFSIPLLGYFLQTHKKGKKQVENQPKRFGNGPSCATLASFLATTGQYGTLAPMREYKTDGLTPGSLAELIRQIRLETSYRIECAPWTPQPNRCPSCHVSVGRHLLYCPPCLAIQRVQRTYA